MSSVSHRKNWSRPQIAQSAVEAFLARELNDWSQLKREHLEDITRTLTERGAAFHTTPRAHQSVCTLIGLEQNAFGFYLDPGTGKSKIALDILRARRAKGEVRRALFLCPSPVTVAGWQEQLRLHAPDLRVMALVGERAERQAALEQEADVYLLNYAGLQVFCAERDARKRAFVPVRGLVERFAALWDMVVFDESHMLGHHDTLVFNLCRPIAQAAKFKYLLTGTPFGRDPQLLWTQLFLLDGGETLGRTLGLFRSAFFSQKQNYWGGTEYKFLQRRKSTLARFLRHRTIRYEDSECHDLPEIVRVPLRVDLPGDAEVLYRRILGELRIEHGNYHAVESAFLRMRQLSSGFVTAKGADEERIEVEFDCPKMTALEELLGELPQDEKVVVFHEFIRSGRRISEWLASEGVKHARLWGGTKDKPAELSRFLTDPACRVLVANTKTGGTGLNLQVARYVVFFESPVSPIIRQQAEKRCHRTGQERRVYIYDLLARGTVDERILEFVAEGRDLFKAICDGQVKLEGAG